MMRDQLVKIRNILRTIYYVDCQDCTYRRRLEKILDELDEIIKKIPLS